MKHRVAGRKLGRTSAHRLSVLRNLSTDLFRHERIQTTLMKAKELRPFAERLITLGRRGDVHARRRVGRHIRDADVARKLVEKISTRFAQRPGGYMRILKLGPRRGDAAEMAIVELIGSEPSFEAKPEEREKKKEKGGLGRLRDRLSRKKSAPEETEEEGAEESQEKKPGRQKAEGSATASVKGGKKGTSGKSKPSGGGGKAKTRRSPQKSG